MKVFDYNSIRIGIERVLLRAMAIEGSSTVWHVSVGQENLILSDEKREYLETVGQKRERQPDEKREYLETVGQKRECQPDEKREYLETVGQKREHQPY